MSPPSLVLLSESATENLLARALGSLPEGERLFLVAPHLQGLTGGHPSINLNGLEAKLRLQIIDSCIAALRPRTILADLASLEASLPPPGRQPQLESALILHDGTAKKKALKAIASRFKYHQIESA